MFNFASKIINSIGDFVSVEEPPKSQPPQQPSLLQRRASGGGQPPQQQQPKARFFGPGAVDYESAFRGPGGSGVSLGPPRDTRQPAYRYPSSAAGGSGGPATNLANFGPAGYGPSASSSGSSTTSGYQGSAYGSSSSSAFGGSAASSSSGYAPSAGGAAATGYPPAGGYRSDRFDENAFKTPDIDYNEDGYNVGANRGNNDQQSFVTEMQKDYSMYRDHDINNMKTYEEEDRYASNYDDCRRRRSVSDSDNSQMKNSNNCDNPAYMNADKNYYTDDQYSFKQPASTNVYENRDLQFSSAESYSSSSNIDSANFGVDSLAQFPGNSVAINNNHHHHGGGGSGGPLTSSWLQSAADSTESYSEQLWKNDDLLLFDDGGGGGGGKADFNDDKPLPSSPTLLDDEAKNSSSRSESESSDEISFGEALATDLIPPHITPEIAARMNIELSINHPKAVIESIYGHSPGEVYTIPEEEDEICSPTGADGVTSLRKQRMASARVETSANMPQDLLNKRRIMPVNQSEQKLKYGITNMETVDKSEQRSIMDESRGVRQLKTDNDGLNIVQKLQPNLNVKFHTDQSSPKQTYRTQPFEQPFQQTQIQENPRLQPQMKDQQFKQDSRQNPAFYQTNQQQLPYMDNRQSQAYSINSNRPPQLYPPDNRFSQPVQANNSQLNYSNVGHQQQSSGHPQQSSGHLQQSSGHPQQSSAQMITADNRQSHPHQEMQPPQFSYQQHPTNQTNRPSQGYPDGRPSQQSAFGSNQVQNPPAVQYQQSTYQPAAPPVNNQQPHQNAYFGGQGAYADNRGPRQPMYPENRQVQQPAYPCDNRLLQDYTPDNRQFHPLANDRVGHGYPPDRRPPPGFQPDNRPPQAPQGYPQTDSRLQPGRQCPPDNRQYQQDYFLDGQQPTPQQGYFENRPPQQSYPADRPGQPYYQDDRPQQALVENQAGYPAGYPPESRRLNQPPQAYQGQNSPQRQLPNVGYQREQQRSGYREPSDSQERRPQIIPHGEFSNPTGHQVRRQLPERQDSLPIDQSGRKRFPLRKYNSEEQHGSIQEEYERQHYGGTQSEDTQYGRVSRHQRPTRSKGPRQRSLSLDSQGDHYHSKSRTPSQERSREEDDYDSPPERYTTESKRSNRGPSGSSNLSKGSQRSPVSSSSRPPTVDRARKTNTWLEGENVEEPRLSERRQGTTSKETKRLAEQSQRSRPAVEVRKGENYCPQHKKFTSTSSSSRPVRRMLPKEPAGPMVLRKNTRTQTQDKSTGSSKSEDSAHHKAGILSTAARKVERGGNLKITFSEPISHLLKPGKGVIANTRTDSSTKTESLKSDKSVISSSIVAQPKNFVYPLSKDKASATLDISASPVSVTSPLSRNQSIDGALKDGRYVSSPGARSLPVTITNRTRSLDRYSSSETNLNCSPYYQDQFSRPGSAPGLMYEPIQQSANSALQLSLYEMHALKKEEKFWSDIYSALPADMKHLIANRGIPSGTRNRVSNSNASFSSASSGHLAERALLENRMLQSRGQLPRGAGRGGPHVRDTLGSSLGERIGNRLRMLHEMKEQAGGVGNRRKLVDSLSRRSASDGDYSFSSSTNFPLYWNLVRRPHSDSAIDLLERLDIQNHPSRVSGSAYNSSELLPSEPTCFKVIDRSQSYLMSPSTNVPPSPAPAHPIRLRDTALRGDHIEISHPGRNFHPGAENRSGFFSCLQNIESLTKQYEEEDRIRSELDQYEDEIYSDSGIPDSECNRFDMHANRRKPFNQLPSRRRNNHF